MTQAVYLYRDAEMSQLLWIHQKNLKKGQEKYSERSQ